MKQLARNLTDAEDGFLGGIRYLILDRDPLYTAAFRAMLRDCSVKSLLLPARSPNLNAYAERFVLSIKSECLDRVIPLNEAHLRRCVREYVSHYHEVGRTRGSQIGTSSWWQTSRARRLPFSVLSGSAVSNDIRF